METKENYNVLSYISDQNLITLVRSIKRQSLYLKLSQNHAKINVAKQVKDYVHDISVFFI